MSFVRSGYVYYQTGSLGRAGSSGYYWLSYAYPSSSQYAYTIYFNTTIVSPARSDVQSYGFLIHDIPYFLTSFVRSGYVERAEDSNGSLQRAGSRSYYWASLPLVNSSQHTYFLYFDTTSIDPVGNDARLSGFSSQPILPNLVQPYSISSNFSPFRCNYLITTPKHT